MRGDTTLGCTGLARVELVVTDVERSQRFYRDVVGLTPVNRRRDGAWVFAVGEQSDAAVLCAGPVVGCRRTAWRVSETSDLDLLANWLAAASIAYRRRAYRDGSEELHFLEPATRAALAFCLPGAADARTPFTPTHTNIQRPGHVVFATATADAAIEHAQ